jgi:hypothetical protein
MKDRVDRVCKIGESPIQYGVYSIRGIVILRDGELSISKVALLERFATGSPITTLREVMGKMSMRGKR